MTLIKVLNLVSQGMKWMRGEVICTELKRDPDTLSRMILLVAANFVNQSPDPEGL